VSCLRSADPLADDRRSLDSVQANGSLRAS
jgi:hypothetical protein